MFYWSIAIILWGRGSKHRNKVEYPVSNTTKVFLSTIIMLAWVSTLTYMYMYRIPSEWLINLYTESDTEVCTRSLLSWEPDGKATSTVHTAKLTALNSMFPIWVLYVLYAISSGFIVKSEFRNISLMVCLLLVLPSVMSESLLTVQGGHTCT